MWLLDCCLSFFVKVTVTLLLCTCSTFPQVNKQASEGVKLSNHSKSNILSRMGALIYIRCTTSEFFKFLVICLLLFFQFFTNIFDFLGQVWSVSQLDFRYSGKRKNTVKQNWLHNNTHSHSLHTYKVAASYCSGRHLILNCCMLRSSQDCVVLRCSLILLFYLNLLNWSEALQ